MSSPALTFTLEAYVDGNLKAKACSVCLGQIEKGATTSQQREVVGQAKTKLGFVEMGVTEKQDVFIFAKSGDAAVGFISLSLMSGGTKSWMINDLVSIQKGAGGTLVNAALKYIAEHPAGTTSVQTVYLLSLDADSTSFWERYGFVSDSTATTIKPMHKDLK